MADEYSDEEFAPDDGDGVAYEAEFDAEEEEEEGGAEPVVHTEDQAKEAIPKPVNDSEDGGGDADDDAYQESFDFDGEMEQGTPATVTFAVTEKVAETEEETEDDAYAQDDTDWREDAAVAVVETHKEADGEEKTEEPIATPSAESNVAPEPPPLVVVATFVPSIDAPSIGRARSSSLSKISALPQIELSSDPEMQAKLIRRSSSPRMRPAPIRRLASLGESGVAEIEAMMVPTNEVTEEAAAVVSAAAMDASVGTLVKRPSAMGSFVPRLPSLMEITPPPIVGADGSREGARSRGAKEVASSGEEDEDEDEDESEEEDEDKDKEEDDYGGGAEGSEERKDQEEDEKDGEGHGEDIREDEEQDQGAYPSDEKASKEEATGDDVNSDSHQSESGKVEPAGTDAMTAVTLQTNTTQVASAFHSSAPDASHGTPHVDAEFSQQGDEATRSTSQLATEHERDAAPLIERVSEAPKPVDAGPEDLLKRVMADVEYKDDMDAELNGGEGEEHAGYAGDDADFIVDAEDENRIETRQLLHEPQMIITKQKEEERSVSPPDPTGYEDEEPFSDDDAEYGEGEDAEDGEDERPALVQYDSDYEELGLDEDEVATPQEDRQTLKALTVVTTQPPEPVTASVATTRSSTEEQRVDKPTDTRNVSAVSATSLVSVEQAPTVQMSKAVPEKVDQTPRAEAVSETRSDLRTASPPAARRSFRPVSASSKAPGQEDKPRSISQGSPRKPAKPAVQSIPTPPPRKPEVPKFTARAPAQQQRITTSPAVIANPVVEEEASAKQNQSVELAPSDHGGGSSRPVSPAKSNSDGTRASSPVRTAQQAPPISPSHPLPRKAPVFKQKQVPKATSPDSKRKKLKPVKCPPNLRIDLASHMDREKREWLLLNMFRHGDDVTKYEAFIPTSSAHEHISAAIASVDMAMGEAKRPLSARQIYGEPPPQRASRGNYSRHGGRKLVERPVDPRLQERESSWVSIKSSESSIPNYDSILDKYCKTVTSPVVQRRIYETREYDLSPQLALVLEKRAFKEWKHGETESGFGSVSKSYKTAVVPPSVSAKSLHPARPPSSSSSTTTLMPRVTAPGESS